MTRGPEHAEPNRPHGAVRRRSLLASAAGATAAGLAVEARADADDDAPDGARTRRMFRHGIASGDPLPRRVVLWTRVSPTAASTPGSGTGPRVDVTWEVARDPRFRRVVARGTTVAGPDRDHTVKVDVGGLRPATWYHYRFRCGGATSRVGRTRTAPGAKASPKNLRVGVVSCANWQAGYFSAYRGLAARDDLHAVVHLGDYIYEYGRGEYGMGQSNVDVRPHVPGHEIVSLRDYRQRHAQYKTDPDLQDAHAKFPWIVTWDDHEVANDQWKHGAENHQPGTEGAYLPRRARAHQAYDEWMPVRLEGTAAPGDGDQIYRRLSFGRLAELSMLDLRSYRSEQAAGPQADAEISDPKRSITGKRQMAWLKRGLGRKKPLWKVVGNPVMIAPVSFAQVPSDLFGSVHDVTGLLPPDGVPYNVDQWDGYTPDRRRVTRWIEDQGIKNALFITGDIHSAWAADIPFDPGTYPASDSAGVELVCTSVTSNNLKDILGVPPRTGSVAVETALKAANRHLKYIDFDSHGFSVLDLTAKRAHMDWFVIGQRDDRDTPITFSVAYEVPVGTNQVQSASGPLR